MTQLSMPLGIFMLSFNYKTAELEPNTSSEKMYFSWSNHRYEVIVIFSLPEMLIIIIFVLIFF